MTNFAFLLFSPDFASFGEAAVAAEKIYAIDPSACVMTCRRAMENVIKWMYSVDSVLSMPGDLAPSYLFSIFSHSDIIVYSRFFISA